MKTTISYSTIIFRVNEKKNQIIITIQKVEVPCKKMIDHLYYIKNDENIY